MLLPDDIRDLAGRTINFSKKTGIWRLFPFFKLCLCVSRRHVNELKTYRLTSSWARPKLINKRRERAQHGNHGRRRRWPLPPPVGCPRPFQLTARVERVRDNVAYDQCSAAAERWRRTARQRRQLDSRVMLSSEEFVVFWRIRGSAS